MISVETTMAGARTGDAKLATTTHRLKVNAPMATSKRRSRLLLRHTGSCSTRAPRSWNLKFHAGGQEKRVLAMVSGLRPTPATTVTISSTGTTYSAQVTQPAAKTTMRTLARWGSTAVVLTRNRAAAAGKRTWRRLLQQESCGVRSWTRR